MYVIRIHMAVNNIQFTKIEIQIAKYLFKHYKNKLNARQLARLLNINHAHANKLCNQLADKKLVMREELGNSVFFSYQYDNKLAIKFMEYMLSMEEFPKWLTVLSHSLKKFKDCIEMGLVFGSSINTKDFNDVDVLLMYDIKKSRPDMDLAQKHVKKYEYNYGVVQTLEKLKKNDWALNVGFYAKSISD